MSKKLEFQKECSNQEADEYFNSYVEKYVHTVQREKIGREGVQDIRISETKNQESYQSHQKEEQRNDEKLRQNNGKFQPMKVLIWLVCFLCYAIIQMIIKDQGVILGGIPTALLFGATWLIAQKLCKTWDKRRIEKKREVTANKVSLKTKFLSFLEMHQKALKIILIVCCVLSIVCLIGYIVCENNMSDALYHYDIAYEKQGTTGCGEWSCKYCEGKATPAPNYLFHGYGSPYEFRYYREVSDTRTDFELVGVIFFVLAVFLLIVWFFAKLYYKAKNREQI